jgi:dipeptidyl aminopeptidase/acylaminoacyl peptidase
MKFISKTLLLSLSLIAQATAVSAQRTITVETFQYRGPVEIHRPVVVDAKDVNDNPFSDKNLLQTAIDIRSIHDSRTILTADTSGFITLPQDSLADALHLLAFHVDADRYANAQLDIRGMGFFEVFVDNAKEGVNARAAKDTDDIDPLYVNLTLEPRRYRITLKYLTRAGLRDTLKLKCLLVAKDSLTQYTVAPEGKRRITVRDIVEGTRLTDAALSPSGKYYVASFSHVDPAGKKQAFHELRERNANRLVFLFRTAEQLSWMPSTDHLCYRRKGERNDDLFRFDPETLRETLLAKDLDAESAVVAPNEQFMIVRKKDVAPVTTGSLKKLSDPDDRIPGSRDRYSLYRYHFAGKYLERITFGKTDTYVADISRDSKQLLCYTSARDLTERPFSSNAFFRINLSNLQVDTLLIDDRFAENARFSPDGQQILFSGTPETFGRQGANLPDGQIANGYDVQAFIMDIATRKVRPFTRHFNPSISGMTWSPWDNRIYLRTADEDRVRIYRYDPRTDQFESLPLQEDVVGRFSIANKGGAALYTGQSVSNPSRLYSLDLPSMRSKLLADPLAENLSEIALGTVTDYHFVSTTRRDTIKGRYYLPPNFDPKRKYPLIVYYYGGTTPTARLFDSRYPLHVYAALGYVVYTLQPSGCIGFGQEFSARHVNAWGLQTAGDIIEGTTRFCESHPFVDPARIGCIGASYGGFMTQYLLTKTHLFAAAASHAGISNIASYWGEGYWGYLYNSIAAAGSYPWNNASMYVDQSPLFHADKINTPLLLLHGSSDTNVPIGESIQMFNALRILGKTVEFISVEGENHAISAHSKRLEWNNSIFAWFAKWLKNEPEWWNALYP